MALYIVTVTQNELVKCTEKNAIYNCPTYH